MFPFFKPKSRVDVRACFLSRRCLQDAERFQQPAIFVGTHVPNGRCLDVQRMVLKIDIVLLCSTSWTRRTPARPLTVLSSNSLPSALISPAPLLLAPPTAAVFPPEAGSRETSRRGSSAWPLAALPAHIIVKGPCSDGVESC